MPTAIVFPSGIGGLSPATATVYTRVKWSDAWVEQPDLHCRRLTRCTCESMSSAEFYWRFGPRLQSGETVWTTQPVLGIDPRCYVRVEISGTEGRDGYTWFGVWDSATKRDKDQTFTAVGLESLLNTPCVDLPWWRPDGILAWTGAGLEFNAKGYPDRSAGKHDVNGVDVYVHSADRATAGYWSTRDAVEMLLAAAAPKDVSGNVLWHWEPVLSQLPDYDRVSLPTNGRTFWNLLQSLIPRHRLIGSKLVCSEESSTGSHAIFEVFTFAETAVDITDNAGDVVGTIPRNSEQVTIDLSEDQSGSGSLSTKASHVVDQVIVRGDRRQIVFTVSVADGTLDKRWTPAEETDYLFGAAGTVNYPTAKDLRGREEADRLYRQRDQVRSVFAWLGLPEEWDQYAGDGVGGAKTPIALVDGDVIAFRVWIPDLEFNRQLPLLAGYDYSGTRIADNDDLGHHGERITYGPFTPLPLLVFLRTKTNDGPRDAFNPDTYVIAGRLGQCGAVEQLDNDAAKYASCQVSALESSNLAQAPGVLEIRVKGEQQHLLAAAECAGSEDLIPGSLDWRDLVATVAVTEQRRVEVRYPADEDLDPLGEQIVRMQIEVANCKLIDVRPNTVVGLDENRGLAWANGGFLRDDRDAMQVLAERAYAWHSVPRYALHIGTGWVDGNLEIGSLVVSYTDAAGTWPVGSVITEITVEFPVGGSDQIPAPKCSVATAFAELDAVRVL